MSFVRRTADRIAGFVVRHAAAGSKEWAEAIAGELAYIESDWQALFWAFSGMRVLLHIQPKPLHSVEDLAEAARKHAGKRRWAVNDVWLARNARWFPGLMFGVQALLQIAMGHSVLGNGLIIVGALLHSRGMYLLVREPNVPDRDDLPGMIRFYRDELASQWTLSRTLWACTSMLFLGFGFVIAQPQQVQRIIGFSYLIALPLLVWQYRRNRRRLAEVETLMADSPFDSQL